MSNTPDDGEKDPRFRSNRAIRLFIFGWHWISCHAKLWSVTTLYTLFMLLSLVSIPAVLEEVHKKGFMELSDVGCMVIGIIGFFLSQYLLKREIHWFKTKYQSTPNTLYNTFFRDDK